jgi:hypothetical protein
MTALAIIAAVSLGVCMGFVLGAEWSAKRATEFYAPLVRSARFAADAWLAGEMENGGPLTDIYVGSLACEVKRVEGQRP